VVAVLVAIAWPAAAKADARLTEEQSVGPSGGNGALAANYRGASADLHQGLLPDH
jgi:hypothetical protein